MKKINIEKKELKKIIGDLEKASDTFAGFGDNFWDMLSENEGNLYGEAEVLLTTCIEKLKKDRLYKKNRRRRQFRKVVSQCFPAIEIICKNQVPNRKIFIAKNMNTPAIQKLNISDGG